jgi:hypothetical protein
MEKSHNAFTDTADPQIVIDIGGGTTDIGIWFEGSLKLQTSIRFASNIVAEKLDKDQAFLSMFLDRLTGQNKASLNTQGMKTDFKNDPTLYFNLIMSNPMLDNSDLNDCKAFRSLLFFKFAAIIYYSGLLVKSLGNTFRGADIYLAGNGPKMLDFIYTGWAENENPLKGAFIDIFRKALEKSDIMVRLCCSSHPKEEAAKGALEGNSSVQQVEAVVLAGEDDFSINGMNIDWKTDLRSALENLKGNTQTPSSSNALQLRKFISLYDGYCSPNKLDLVRIKDIDNMIRVAMNQAVNDMNTQLGKDQDSRTFTPLFISEVKSICLSQGSFMQ